MPLSQLSFKTKESHCTLKDAIAPKAFVSKITASADSSELNVLISVSARIAKMAILIDFNLKIDFIF